MSKDICYNAIREKLGDKATKQDIKAIVADMETLKSKLFDRYPDLTSKQFRDAAMEFINNRREQAAARRMEAATNILATQKNLSFLDQPAFKDQPWEGVKAMLSGTTINSKEGNRSVDLVSKSLRSDFMSVLDKGIEATNARDSISKGILDKNAMIELDQFKPGGKPGKTGDQVAQQFAKAIHDVNQMMLKSLQSVGSSIRDLPGYIMKQSHDREKIIAAGFEKWLGDIMPKLDLDKTFQNLSDTRGRYSMMKDIYDDIVQGRYNTEVPKGVSDQFITAVGETKNVNAQVSKGRVLHFADGESFYDYNQQYGKKTLLGSTLSAINGMSRNIAMMDRLGTNPDAQYQGLKLRVKSMIEKSSGGDSSLLQRFENQEPAMDRLFNQVKGVYDQPGTGMDARIGQNIRTAQVMAKMGNVMIHTFSDLPMAAADVKSSTGKGYLQSVSDNVKNWMDVAGAKNLKKWAGVLGQYVEDHTNEVLTQIGGDTAEPGIKSKMIKFFGKYSGHDFMVETNRVASAKLFSEELASHADTPFGELPDRIRSNLERYGFNEDMWKMVGRGVQTIDGRSFVTPEGMRSIPDELFPNGSRGKFNAQTAVLSYLNDHADIGSSTPNARVKLLTNWGTKDEGFGVLVRLLTQFKQFPLTYFQNFERLGMSNPETNPTNYRQAVLQMKGDMWTLAQFTIAASAMGYMRMALMDMTQGKTPRDPTDPKVAGEAFVRGGAAGIYGDYLFGEFNRRYRGAADVMLGPSLGDGAKVLDMWSELRRGELKAGEAMKFAMDQVPFHNLFYTKLAFDHLLINRAMEFVDPGHLRRQDQSAKKNPGLFDDQQHYWLKPTEGNL